MSWFSVLKNIVTTRQILAELEALRASHAAELEAVRAQKAVAEQQNLALKAENAALKDDVKRCSREKAEAAKRPLHYPNLRLP